jgi:hypothetical protein
MFDLVEEPLNQVAGAVEVGAEADRVVAIASRRDVWPALQAPDIPASYKARNARPPDMDMGPNKRSSRIAKLRVAAL